MCSVYRSFRVSLRTRALCAAVCAALAVGACGSDAPSIPSQPTPPPVVTPPPPPPLPAPNLAPVITSLTLSSPRVEADEEVRATAVVTDVETPVNQLTYEWSATPVAGRFSGSGAQVTWTAPHLQKTPDIYRLTATVTEKYTQDGQAKENKTSSTVEVHYNDSYRDVSRISMRFLTELFPTYSVTPTQAVQDFSDNCPAKSTEHDEIEVNRQLYRIESGTYSISSITLNAAKTSGTVVGTCVFKDSVAATGVHEVVTGICTLQTVYENWNWLLCESRFAGTGTTTLSTNLQGRVPGRIASPH
jgi:hypothetical protein